MSIYELIDYWEDFDEEIDTLLEDCSDDDFAISQLELQREAVRCTIEFLKSVEGYY